MTVQPVLPVGITIHTATNPACVNTAVAFVATPVNGGTSPAFQWKLNGANVGSNLSVLSITPASGDVISCQLTSSALCYTGSRTVTSNAITMVVSSELPASVSIISSQNPFCQGSSVSFIATPGNGGTNPSYQWKVNCVNTGTNSASLNYIPVNGDFVTCQMTSNLTCAVLNPAISNAITMALNTGTPASISVTTAANPVCQSTPVTFNASVVNGGSLPVYQWKVNGTNTGTNSPVLSYTPANGDAVTCKLTSNAACVSGSPATSVPLSMAVSPGLPASVTISAGANPFCQGTPVSFIALPVNGGPAPLYQWQINGINSGAPSTTPTFTCTPANGDGVNCLLTSNASCVNGSNPVASNQVVLLSASSLAAGVSIVASANSVCQGTPVTFTATPSNGGDNPVFQWKVNGVNTGINNSTYTYSPNNGDVITCQLTSGLSCAISNPATSNAISMVVNPIQPASISITASINPCCIGTSVNFTALATNPGTGAVYQWKVNCVNVGTNSTTYTYVPVNGDVVVCVLTSDALCNSGSPATSNNINMVVLPLSPVSITISTLENPFCIGSPVAFTAVPVNGGVSPFYQWKVNGINSGTGSTNFTYTPVNGDIVTCELTSSLTCITVNPALSNPIVMIGTNVLPASVNVVSNWSYVNNTICQGTTAVFTATPVNGGSSPFYIWKVNGIHKGSNIYEYQYTPVNGDMITCQVISSLACAMPDTAMSNTITMTVNPSQPLAVSIAASANPSCLGDSVFYTCTAINGGTNPVYRWRVNGINTGTSTASSTFKYIPVNGDVVLCRVTSNAQCVTGSPLSSNGITMVVSPTAPATVTIAASANPVCQATQVTFTATPFNGGSAPFYQWKVNGINSGTNSATFLYAPSNGDVVTCQMISSSLCATVTQVTSNSIIMTVSPVQQVSITIVASSNPVCIGSAVTFTSAPINGGSSPVYQWKVNGVIVGSSSPVYSYIPVNGDIVTCKLTSNASCSLGNPAVSNSIIMNVSESLAVGVSIAASENPSCQGQPVGYIASAVNAGANPIFQWRINGIDVGTNSPGFTYSPSNGDFVTCQLTSSFSCGTGNPAGSNQINTIVQPPIPVSVSISSSANPVCLGTSVTLSSNVINGGSAPVYQWRVNGMNVGANLPFYTYYAVNGDVVDCQLTSNANCPLNNPVVSNVLNMTVVEPGAAGIFITPSVNPVCPGTSVTFTPTLTNGGSSPMLQWMVNGIITGSNAPTYTFTPVNGDIVTCMLTSNSTCVTGATAMSNPVTMEVNTTLNVDISIAASANPSCPGQLVTYTATGINGGSSPVYQWMVNGIDVGTNSAVFGFTPVNGDIVSCWLISDFTCAQGNPALSNQIIMEVSQSLPSGISIAVSSNPVCLGSQATFTASPVNGGTNPVYTWKVNGIVAGTNTPLFTYFPANGDVVTCQIISTDPCANGNPAFSNPIGMVVSTELPVGITIIASANQVCEGTAVSFSAVSQNGGSFPVFQWKVNGINTGLNVNSFSYIPVDGDVVTCHLTSDLTCATGNPASSNVIVMNVYAGQNASVNLTANPAGPVCDGTVVVFTATPVNGGSPSFQWYKNSLPVGSNQPSYSTIPQNGDVFYVVMTSGIPCVSGSPATSNSLTITVTPAVASAVTISSDLNNVCQGTSVIFTANPVNGGNPVYQWYVNTLPVGLNQPAYSYVPVNGDLVKVVMTSSLSCVSGSPATSNTLTMTVNAIVPVSVTIFPDQNNVCQGTLVTCTATPVNGGTPVYQWYVNNLPVGTNQPVFSYFPANSDQVYVSMTSSLSCSTGNPASSNIVDMIVINPVQASVSIIADQNNVCQGTNVTFTAAPVNGGTPIYQWYANNLAVGLNEPTLTYMPANGDIVHLVMTSTLLCVSGSPAISNSVTMQVNASVPAGVEISPDQNNVCQGTQVTFNAVPFNGGTPSFQWYVNNIPVGANTPEYSYFPENDDLVHVSMNSNLLCVTGSPASSNVVRMIVNSPLPASVSILADQNDVCEGTSVVFSAIAINGGTPTYQWYTNNLPVGVNQSSYTYVPSNGDQVSLLMTSSETCVSGSPATSNTIFMATNPVLPVFVSVVADQNNICQGASVIFTTVSTNAGVPAYQWYLNGLPEGLNQPTFTCIPSNGDLVHVVMTSSLACVAGNPATSNMLSIVVRPNAGNAESLNGIASVCAGAQGVDYSVAAISNATNYAWSLPFGATIAAGNNTEHITVNFSADAVSGDIKVQGSNSCGSGAFSPAFPVAVNAIPSAPVVSIQWPILESSSTEGNQWYFEGVLIPEATGQTYHALEPGWYWATTTSLTGCISDSSNHVYVDATDPGEIIPGILVYPVPNNGRFTISFALLSEETFSITIYNSIGKKCFEMPEVLVKSTLKQIVDLRPVSIGVYTVVIKCPDYSVVKQIVIVKK
jgi:hypothetical protein